MTAFITVDEYITHLRETHGWVSGSRRYGTLKEMAETHEMDHEAGEFAVEHEHDERGFPRPLTEAEHAKNDIAQWEREHIG